MLCLFDSVQLSPECPVLQGNIINKTQHIKIILNSDPPPPPPPVKVSMEKKICYRQCCGAGPILTRLRIKKF